MSKENWILATTRYLNYYKTHLPPNKNLSAIVSAEAPQGDSIETILNALNKFFEVAECGPSSFGLLYASKRHVVFAQDYQDSGNKCVYYFRHDGFRRCIFSAKQWQTWGPEKTVFLPEGVEITLREVAKGIVSGSRGKARADEVITFLKDQLDAIAAEADKLV